MPPPSTPSLRAKLLGWAQCAWAPVGRTSAGRFLTDTALAGHAVIKGFRGEDLSLRAAALTYISTFSLVPLLTVGFVLLRALHQESFQRRLRFAITEMLAPGVREESAAFLDRFLHPAGTIAIGSFGFLALLLSAGSLLRHIDAAVNAIWGIQRQRPIMVRVGIYGGLLLLGPVFLAASFSGTGMVRAFLLNNAGRYAHVFVSLGTTLLALGALTLLYYWTPHAHLRIRSALAGGLVAGLAWMLAKQGYADIAERSFAYNPIYGTLGALPFFLAWIYVSWFIVLAGARLSYAVEHVSFRDSLWAFGSHPRALELVGARIALEATLAWVDGRTPPLARELAKQLRVPEPFVHETVERMLEGRLLERVRRGGLRPAKDPAELTLADLTLAVHGVMITGGRETWTGPRAPGFEQVEPIFQESDCAGIEVLRRTRWLDLVIPLRPGLLAPAAPPAPEAAAEG
ncbi:YihY/virulence factor BrkB family protein [Myxococcaceae bacterium GXIMD 01537]